MKIFSYADYSDYVRAQVDANRKKIKVVWVTPYNIDLVCSHHGPGVLSVLCHGTRNGMEQKLFAGHYPDAEIIGTEIAPNASLFPRTICWDMQKRRAGWVGKFDIVFSNALDHAIEPEQTIRHWLEQLCSGGRLYVDHAHDPRVNRSDRTDPLEINDDELTTLIERCGGLIEERMAGFGPRNCRTLIYAVRRGA